MITETQIKLIQQLLNSRLESCDSFDDSYILRNLNFVLYDNPKLLDASIDIIDNLDNKIIKYKSITSSREFWKVNGSHGNQYLCFENFCPCQSFLQQSKSATGQTYCKHILSIKLGSLFKRIVDEVISEELFISTLCSDSLIINNNQYSNSFHKFGTNNR